MPFVLSLGTLLYVSVLSINGVAILNEDRFLSRIGLGSRRSSYEDITSIKSKIVNLISAVRTLLRFPLIILNLVLIIYELIFG